MVKGNEVLAVLQTELSDWHGARIKFVALFVLGVIKVGLVRLSSIAGAMDGKAEKSSVLRRIERFLGKYKVQYEDVARLLVRFMGLEAQAKWVLTLDRTEWKWGKTHLNILLLGVAYKGIAVPLFWKVLEGEGISTQAERKELLQTFINCFGKARMACLVGDREFIGKDWFSFLLEEQVPFVMRLRENFYVEKGGKRRMLKDQFARLAKGKVAQHRRAFKLWGLQVHLTAARLEEEWLFLASPPYCLKALDYYKQRWEIETLFKALKTQGFNLEDTHLSSAQKLERLLALLAIAFVWCYKAGVHLDQQKPIRLVKKANAKVPLYSFFKYGLDHLQHLLLNACKPRQLKQYFTLLSGY